MEEELILQQPVDRRLGNTTDLPPGPPGAECDSEEFVTKPLAKSDSIEKEEQTKKSSSRRRSKSPKPKSSGRSRLRSPSPQIRRLRSPSPSPRSRRSPSPSPRRRRSPSPRRGRYYSPERRRYDRRRSPIRRGSPPPRRYGGGMRGGMGRRSNSSRSRSRTRSRSPTPPPKRRAAGSGSRWANKDKPPGNMSLGPVPPPTTQGGGLGAGGPTGPPPVPYGVMPPNTLYGNDGYVNASGYNHPYVVPPPPPQAGFPPQPDAYGAMQPPSAPGFNAGYPPPQAWGAHDPYVQQPWMGQGPVPDAAQISNQMQHPSPVTTAMTTQMAQQPNATTARSQTQEFIGDAAPGTMESATIKGTTSASSVQDAVAQEAENQRDELKHQRNSYLNKTSMLKMELKMLKDQRKDLESGGAPPSPTTKNFIDENQKLQTQIEKKLSAIENVIDMLTNLIGDDNLNKDSATDVGDVNTTGKVLAQTSQQSDAIGLNAGGQAQAMGSNKKRHISGSKTAGGTTTTTSSSSDTSTGSGSSTSDTSTDSSTDNDEDDDDDSSSEKLKTKAIESMKSKQRAAVGTISVKKDLGALQNIAAKEEKVVEEKKFNYIFYDPETHWCQICNVFPKTARDYLNHLHTKEHMDREGIDTPWHLNMINDQFPTHDNAPVKRQAIRGLTFFVPATAWYCKLCNFWMGDLHCASTHLKSQQHSEKYNAFLVKNPQHEENWLAERQRILTEKSTAAAAAEASLQNALVSNESVEQKTKKSKKDDGKASKKRKKKSSDKKDKKKKRKHSKKRKKAAVSSSSSSSSSDSSSSDTEEQPPKTNKKKAATAAIVIKDLDNPNPAASIRVAMRKQENGKLDVEQEPTAVPPPPPPAMNRTEPQTAASKLAERLSKWSQENIKVEPTNTNDDSGIIQQWNTVQPVISDSEKKLLEQLKGKLKNKPNDDSTAVSANVTVAANTANSKVKPASTNSTSTVTDKNDRDKQSGSSRNRRDFDNDRRGSGRRGRSRSPGYDRGDRYRGGRSRSRSRSRSRGGFGFRRGGGGGNSRRSRSRSRGRNLSPLPRGGGGRGRRGRSPSPRRNRRSRSRDRRRRSRTRSRTPRSRSRSTSYTRIEKPIVKHSEFRPRVPEKDKEKEKKAAEAKDKKEANKKSTKTSSGSSGGNSAAGGGNAAGGSKKLPFIGKMPVFKKQAPADGVPENGSSNVYNSESAVAYTPQAAVAARPPAPTAAQIQMAMMEDVYGNAPPFHPDAGMMMDYDDLMPDPMQFANIMGQGIPPPPPPPPPPATAGAPDAEGDKSNVPGEDIQTDDDTDILPPGIDAIEEEEEYVPKPPIPEPPVSQKGPLPKDLEEALDIIFPTEKNMDDDSNDSVTAKKRATAAAGQTQIIIDEPVMQVEDLIKEGIHMVSIEETSMLGMDEASKMSMNEPLVFNNKKSAASNSNKFNLAYAEQNLHGGQAIESSTTDNASDIDINAALAVSTPPPPPPPPLVPPDVDAGRTGTAGVTHKDDLNEIKSTSQAGDRTVKNNRSRSNSTTSSDSNSSGNSSSISRNNSTDSDDNSNERNSNPRNNLNNDNSNSKTLSVNVQDMEIADMETESMDKDDNPTQQSEIICATTIEYDLNDIPEPPPSPTESEKNRRKEELDDLAMLGIDADDMAAQCM